MYFHLNVMSHLKICIYVLLQYSQLDWMEAIAMFLGTIKI